MPVEVDRAFCDNAHSISRSHDHRKGMSHTSKGNMHVSVDTDCIAALWRDTMHDSRPGACFEEVLNFDLRGLNWIGIFQREVFLEIITGAIPTNAPLCKIPGSAGGSGLMRNRQTKRHQVLREIVGIIGTQACGKIIGATIRIGSAATHIIVVIYISRDRHNIMKGSIIGSSSCSMRYVVEAGIEKANHESIC